MIIEGIKVKETAVVVLNYNGQHLLEELIPKSISRTNIDEKTQLIVVDNASTDNSVAWMSSNFPNVPLLQLDKNYGFTGGYNKSLECIEAAFFVLLSSDVEVEKNWLTPLIDRLKSNSRIAACQPKVLSYYQRDSFEYAGASGGFIDALGMPFCRGRIFNTIEKDVGQYDNAIEIKWASGCCFAIKSEAWKKMRGFDEDFFAHMEEVDLCWRLNGLGFSIFVEPKSVVYHMGGETLNYNHPKKLYLNYRNNYAMLLKNQMALILVLLLPFRFIVDILAAFYFMSKNGPLAFVAVFKAQVHFLLRFSHWLKTRKKVIRKRSKIKYIYSEKSIALAYFLGNKKQFSQLERKIG